MGDLTTITSLGEDIPAIPLIRLFERLSISLSPQRQRAHEELSPRAWKTAVDKPSTACLSAGGKSDLESEDV